MTPILIAVTLAAAPALPADVRGLSDNVEACIHFAGEEPYDAERGKFLAEQIEQTCTPAKRDLPRLKAKYANDPAASAAIAQAKADMSEAFGPE